MSFGLARPVYFLSLPISAHMIFIISSRLHEFKSSEASSGCLDNAWISSLLSLTLKPFFLGNSVHTTPAKAKAKAQYFNPRTSVVRTKVLSFVNENDKSQQPMNQKFQQWRRTTNPMREIKRWCSYMKQFCQWKLRRVSDLRACLLQVS